jgi:virginiamycin B lyase
VRPLLLAGALLAVGVAAAAPPRPPAAPTVLGPRRTSAATPVYRFRAARAVSFRCAFDSVRLHRCRARYSQRLAPGPHVLRVRALGARGAVSRVVRVSVRVVPSLPALQVGSPIAVGSGAGVPTVANGAVWVPTTGDGGLVKVVGRAVASRTQVGPRSLSGEGYLDAAVAGGGAVWSASDIGSTIARVDRVSGATTTLAVPERPGGLTEGDGAVWAFHFLQPAISRIDASRATATRLDVPGASGVGLAYGGGSLWLLSLRPNRILELDPATGAARRMIPLSPRLTRRPSLIDAWWLAYGEDAVWATLPNYRAVARVDTATGAARYLALDQGRPFGIAVGGGSAWIATDRGVVRLDGRTGAPMGAASLPPAQTTAFVSVAYGDGAAWVTNFDRGTLTRVDDPAAP